MTRCRRKRILITGGAATSVDYRLARAGNRVGRHAELIVRMLLGFQGTFNLRRFARHALCSREERLPVKRWLWRLPLSSLGCTCPRILE